MDNVSLDKINFNNNTSPYISDTNLNLMQDNTENGINALGTIVENYINEKIKRNIIVAYLYEGSTLTTGSDQLALIPLSRYERTGTKLTFDSSSHAIVVGAGVQKLKISANINYASNNSTSTRGLIIYKNNSLLITLLSSQKGAFGYENINLLDTIISVNEGDVLDLRIRSVGQTNISVTVNGSGSQSSSKLIAEVIE